MDIDDGDVGIYLFELDVHGVGGTLDEALEDLAEAMLGTPTTGSINCVTPPTIATARATSDA